MPGPCKIIRYHLSAEHYNRWSVPKAYQGSRSLHIFYADTSVRVRTETLILTPSAYVGSIGGSLGLFLGLSLLSLAFMVADLAATRGKNGGAS